MSAKIKIVNEARAIDGAIWDALANPCEKTAQPFLRHDFFCAAEESGSACAQSGWQAQHLVLEKEGEVCGVMPLYLKGHSQGEYVFDHGWADAFYRAGGEYYPKLLCAVPFTPVAGRRLFCAPDDEMVLIAGANALVEQLGVSSLHINFMEEPAWRALADHRFLQRTDQQFHWHNQEYRDFSDFLDALSSRKRKTLRKERERALSSGIEVEWLVGRDLRTEHWEAFFEFYIDTGARKWGHPYLTRDFFARIGETMKDDILLIMARRDGRYIAGALNFIGGDALYGRNWGCVEDHPFLHFELCYYQAIDFAIARGLQRVEAGAQGAHKLARGYEPVRTYSAHYIAHNGLRAAVANYLESERQYVDDDIAALSTHMPFKKEAKREIDND